MRQHGPKARKMFAHLMLSHEQHHWLTVRCVQLGISKREMVARLVADGVAVMRKRDELSAQAVKLVAEDAA